MRDAGLTGVTIYKNPSDYPGMYVARAWIAVDGAVIPSDSVSIAVPISEAALDGIRRTLSRRGAVRFPRQPQDDPVILETWM